MLGGCSLSSISHLDLRECSHDVDCAPLNEADGFGDGECVLWQCNSRRACELRERDDDDDGAIASACGGTDCDDADASARPGNVETCDGIDNDCNGQIDDLDDEPALDVVVRAPDPRWSVVFDGWLAYPSASGAALDVLTGVAEPTPLGFAHGESFSSAGLVGGCETRIALEPRPPTSMPVGTSEASCQTHAECDDGVLCNGFETCDPRSPDADGFGCRANGAPACSEGACDEEAGVCRQLRDDLACEAADLVVAASRGGRAFVAVIDDVGCAAGRARVGLLDTDARIIEQRGDARRSAVWPTLDDDCRGATLPAIASLPPDPDRARFRTQALLAWVEDCHDVPCNDVPRVRLVGLWDEEGTAGGDPVAWVHGTSVATLESVRTDARPAIAALDAGYVLGFPAPDGGAWVYRLEAHLDPAGVSSSQPHRTHIDPESGPRAAVELEVAAPTRIAAGRAVRDLVLARDARGVVGVAWQEPDGTFFATLNEGALSAVDRIGDSGVELSLVATDEGWLASWVSRGRVWLRRLNREGRIEGPARSFGRDPRLPRPHIDADGRPSIVFHDGDRGAFVQTAGICGAR